MKIISTSTFRSLESQFDGLDSTEHEIQTESSILQITQYDEAPDRWFVSYILSDRNILRILDRMDKAAWRRVWAEFRQLQH